eukprot:TRINITY_DN3212_c0_g1_i1.p3 TRINITY_DN3212_c0_g1~~TRINITY_DN3212_c0_g1_i1.p3  ORF type:complete len:410 (+),score=70.15 TRINITY_DN3212_c0_g1_i1:41-1231(+)
MAALPFLRWLRRPPPPPPPPRTMRLLDLPDDVLSRVLAALLAPLNVGSHAPVLESGFVATLPLALTCRRLYALFHAQLNDLELWQTARLDDRGLISLSRHVGGALRRIALRRCFRLSARSLHALATHCPRLRALDLSGAPVGDAELSSVLCGGAAPQLRALLLRRCVALSDASLSLIAARCPQLRALDVGALPNISDAGVAHVAAALQNSLTMIVLSECAQLSDAALMALGRWCPRLQSVTCRSLPLVTNEGVDALCRGARTNLAMLDVLHCEQIKARAFLDSVRRYCPLLARRLRGTDGRSLRQMVISALSGLIFHVTGSDVHNGKTAVYFLLVDPGTSNSFRVGIGSACLDLTNYGCILASCFGDAPDEQVKHTLLTEYGLDLDAETERARVRL